MGNEMHARMAAGFAPAFEGEQAVAEPASTGASSGASPTPQTGAEWAKPRWKHRPRRNAPGRCRGQ